jgi:hypothetical protein
VPVAFQFRCQFTVSSTARREDGLISSGRVSISKKMDGILWSVWVQYRFRSAFMHFTPQRMLLKITRCLLLVYLFIQPAYIEFSLHLRVTSELIACSYLYLPTSYKFNQNIHPYPYSNSFLFVLATVLLMRPHIISNDQIMIFPCRFH